MNTNWLTPLEDIEPDAQDDEDDDPVRVSEVEHSDNEEDAR